MVIVDTSVWIEYLRGTDHPETEWLDRELDRRPLGLTDLILCEVLQGTRDPGFSRVRSELLKLHIFPNCSIELAIAAAENYRKLRRAGFTVRTTVDSLIATFCLRGNHSLLHRDHDFVFFENVLGLKVVHP
jgi:predicted nucleic acid-binding protein